MKKLITMMIAVLIIAFSCFTAFAKVQSPVATKSVSGGGGGGSSSTVTSPKTGSDDALVYALIAASVVGCGVASVALAKTAKKD